MIASLAFNGGVRLRDGRLIRRHAFVPRSTSQLEAVCRVANVVGDRLAELFACAVSIEIIEPVSIEASMHERLLAGAQVLRVHGESADAFVIVRQRDARRFADFAFARNAAEKEAALSVLESRLIRRVSHAIAAACTPLCGRLEGIAADTPQRTARDAVVYFEMRFPGPLRAAVGVALTREPRAVTSAVLQANDLRAVRIQARAMVGRGSLSLATIARLAPGSLVALNASLGDPGTLEIGGRAIVWGQCGVDRNRAAFQVSEKLGA